MNKKCKGLLSILLVLILLFCMAPAALADAGDFSGDYDYGGWDSGSDWDWDSGSDWDWDSGSDWDWDWSSGSDWSSSDDLSSDSDEDGLGIGCCGVVIIVVVLIIIFIRKNKGGKGGGSSSGKNTPGAVPRGAAPTNKATVDPKELKEKDSNFSEQEILEKVSNAYVQMQNCWQSKKWEPMRALMTDALYSQFDRQLQALKRNGQTNYVERIAVLGVRFVDYYQDKVNDNLVVELRTRIVDYTVNDATGQVVSGSKTAEKFMTYEWTLIRSLEHKTADKQEVNDLHCPNCGAPLDVNHSAQCEYCGQVIVVNDYDWVISAIRGISQVTKG